MGLLYASELKDSREWVLQNAKDILDSVKNAGGWAKVFPGRPELAAQAAKLFQRRALTYRKLGNTKLGNTAEAEADEAAAKRLTENKD